MKVLNCVLGLLLVGSVAPAAGPQDVAGEWTVNVQMGEQAKKKRSERAVTLIIETDGDKLSGVWKAKRREYPLSGIVFAKGKLSFSFTRETEGGIQTMKYAGSLDGDELKGRLTGAAGSVVANGTRGGSPPRRSRFGSFAGIPL